MASAEAAREKQADTLRGALEKTDRNAADIQTARNELQALRQKVERLEAGMRSRAAADSAQILELKENMSFLNTQVINLDNSLRGELKSSPEREPAGAGVFKPNGFNIQSAYKKAMADFQARRYEAAIGKFNEICVVAPSNSLADNAQYWIGECWYALRDYERSRTAFQKVFSFPKTNKAADARLMIGMIHLHLNNRENAREELHMVVDQYPSSDAARIAAVKLKEMGKE